MVSKMSRACLEELIDLQLFSGLVDAFWDSEEQESLLYLPNAELEGTVSEYMQGVVDGTLEIRQERATVLALTLSKRRVMVPDIFQEKVKARAKESGDLCFWVGSFLFGDVGLPSQVEGLGEIALVFLLPEEYAQEVWLLVRDQLYAELMCADLEGVLENASVWAYLADVIGENVQLRGSAEDALFKALCQMRSRVLDPQGLLQLERRVCLALNYSVAKHTMSPRRMNLVGPGFLKMVVSLVVAALSDKTPLTDGEKAALSEVMLEYEKLPKKVDKKQMLGEFLEEQVFLRNADTFLWFYREFRKMLSDLQVFGVSPRDQRFAWLWTQCSTEEALMFFSLYLREVDAERLSKEYLQRHIKLFEDAVGVSFPSVLEEKGAEVVPFDLLLQYEALPLAELDFEAMPDTFWYAVEEQKDVVSILKKILATGTELIADGKLKFKQFLSISWNSVLFGTIMYELQGEDRKLVLDWLDEYVFLHKSGKYVAFLLQVLMLPWAEECYGEELARLVQDLKAVPNVSSYSGAGVLRGFSNSVRFANLASEIGRTGGLCESSVERALEIWDSEEFDLYADAEDIQVVFQFLWSVGRIEEDLYEEVMEELEGVVD